MKLSQQDLRALLVALDDATSDRLGFLDAHKSRYEGCGVAIEGEWYIKGHNRTIRRTIRTLKSYAALQAKLGKMLKKTERI